LQLLPDNSSHRLDTIQAAAVDHQMTPVAELVDMAVADKAQLQTKSRQLTAQLTLAAAVAVDLTLKHSQSIRAQAEAEL
jgi:hypothetical protein